MKRLFSRCGAALSTPAILLCALVYGGCDGDPLNITPTDRIIEETVWQDPALVEAFLNNIYKGMDHGANQGQLGTMSDEASAVPDLGTGVVVEATVTPGNMGILADGRSDQFKWDELYSRIREVNVFLNEIDEAAVEDQELKDRMTAEAHFLRAYFYHNLMRAFGGVPIVTDVAELGDQELNVPRNSFAETVDFIVSEAEAAAALLPTFQTGVNLGRATRGAALALKARVLLYAASDLYHANPSGMPETGYTEGRDRTQMWQDARAAAQAVMDLGLYRLFGADPAPGDSTALNYYRLFHTPDNGESIMERYFTIGDRFGTNQNYRPHIYHGPNGFHQWGGATPIQQLVDAYSMADGSEFSWDDPEHAANPYDNRDPRFYATILFDGAAYRERPADVQALDRSGVIQTFKALELPDGTIVPGADTRDSPIEPWNGTWSGYYVRKILDDDALPSAGQDAGIWIYFRYGEILLNYAEASIELGEYAAARDALNQIRRRAGMPEFDASATGQALKEAYRHERRIEMAFEEQRFFDIRRWMIAPDVMNEPAQGINITARATNRADRSTYGDYRYEVMTYQNRAWNDKLYFFPISAEEMNRNNNLVQNPGY